MAPPAVVEAEREVVRGKRDPDLILLPAADLHALRADPRGEAPYALTVERGGRRVAWRLGDGPPQRLGDVDGGPAWPEGPQVTIGPDGTLWTAARVGAGEQVSVTRRGAPASTWVVDCGASCASAALMVASSDASSARLVAAGRAWTLGAGPVVEVDARSDAGRGDGAWRAGERVGWGEGPGVTLGACPSPGPGHGAVVELGLDWAIDACGTTQLVGEHGARLSVGSGLVDGATWSTLLAAAPAGLGEAGRLWVVSVGPGGARLSAWSPEDVFPVGWTSWELAAGAKRALPAPAPLRAGLPARATFEVTLPDGAEIRAAALGAGVVWLGGRIPAAEGSGAVALRVRGAL